MAKVNIIDTLAGLAGLATAAFFIHWLFEPPERGFYYKKKLLEVTCTNFKGRVYQLGHTTAGVYHVRYEDEQGRRIEFPSGCIKLELEYYPNPTEGEKQ